jgi:mannose-6-phosphate isomerase-like protein (cupin superfamily)
MQRSPARWAPPRPGVCYKGAVLVRRLAEAPTEEWHRLRNHILMDAGELGSRNISVTWLEVPTGIDQELHSHEEAEQVYVVVHGSGTMSATGDTQRLDVGDLVLIPPATDHAVANDDTETLALVSVQSPAVSADELYSRRLAAQAANYDDYEDE